MVRVFSGETRFSFTRGWARLCTRVIHARYVAVRSATESVFVREGDAGVNAREVGCDMGIYPEPMAVSLSPACCRDVTDAFVRDEVGMNGVMKQSPA